MATRTRKSEHASERQEAGADSRGEEIFRFDGSITRMLGWPVEVWLRCQAGMLKAVEPAASSWLERQREAANGALDTFEKLSGCADLQEAAAIQRAWLDETMKRLNSDLSALADQAMAVSNEAMIATRHAARTSSEAMALAIQPAARHEEPVEEAA